MKLGPVIVFTAVFDECVAFYTALLGCEPASESPSYVEFHVDGGVFGLHRSGRHERTDGPVHVHFVTGDLTVLKRRAEEAGFPPVSGPTEEPWGRELSFVDPGGLALEVLEERRSPA